MVNQVIGGDTDKKYREFDLLPAFEKAVFGDDGKSLPSLTDLPRWSGANHPQDTGSFVMIKNGIGPAKVIGYCTQDGWLGLLVKPLDPSTDFIRSHGYNATANAFGREVEPEPIPCPLLKGPNQEQLAALQHYAISRGRSWKQDLNTAWMNGADAREDDGHLLRQVRNDFGPTWLHSRRNPIKPKTTRTPRR
jgi:hypothetical protein